MKGCSFITIRSSMNNSTIKFAGIPGKIIKSSPHNNYQVIELSDRITIIGTKSNQFHWSEIPDADSGFTSFIAYIGSTTEEQSCLYEQIQFYGGEIDSFRAAKRNLSFPLEFKVRNLSIPSLLSLFNELQG